MRSRRTRDRSTHPHTAGYECPQGAIMVFADRRVSGKWYEQRYFVDMRSSGRVEAAARGVRPHVRDVNQTLNASG